MVSEVEMSREPKFVFAPQPKDGRILSMMHFRGTLLVACDYALYQLTPTDGPEEWIIELVSQNQQIPACVRY
jgi:hypothetical protein